MTELNQERAPIYEALERLKKRRVVPFDVPGHKRGHGNPELVNFLGEKCVGIDVNSMKPLDNLCQPISVPPLVAGDIERYNPSLLKPLERLIDRRPLLI